MKNARKNAQSLVEYGLILALVAVIAVTILGRFSTAMNKTDNQKVTGVSSVEPSPTESYCKSINKTYDEANKTCK